MNPTIEQAIEIIRQLPPPEREKLFDWAEKEKQRELSEKKAKKNEIGQKNEKFRRALQWLEEHKEQYDGQWVVLDGDVLIAHGKDAKSVYEEARAKGIQSPFLERVKAKVLPW